MQSTLAISLLAVAVSHGVLAAPMVPTVQAVTLDEMLEDSLVESAASYEASMHHTDIPVIMVLDDLMPEEQYNEGEAEPLPEGAEMLDSFEPPPIFDPAEPRPQSIFVTVGGEAPEDLPKPPPISFTRPEHLSAFDAGNQPQDSPFPPDFFGPSHDTRFDPCPMWQAIFKMSGAMMILLVAAVVCTMIIERMLSQLWRQMTAHRVSSPRGILEVDPMLEDKRRPRSDSTRSSMWSRSQSPPKISLA